MRHIQSATIELEGRGAGAATIDTAALIARLDRARGAGPAALAIDGDGTLWRPDVGHALVERALVERALRPEALTPLQALARAHGLLLADEANEQLAALVAAYVDGVLPAAAAFRVGALLFAGQRVDEAAAWGEELLAALGDHFRVPPGWAPVLEWAHAAEVEVWVVSAGGWPGAVAAARRVGVPASRVLAFTTLIDDDVVTGELQRPLPHGAGKPRLLRARAGASTRLLAAFGDDPDDAPLLAAAELPVAIAGARARRLQAPGVLRWDPTSELRA